MNTRLLRKVQKHINNHPGSFSMLSWSSDINGIGLVQAAQCGTVHCIGGWAVALDPSTAKALQRQQRRSWWQNKARRVLGLTAKQAERLFFIENWPPRHCSRYLLHGSGYNPAGRRATKAVHNRIEHFIKTRGKE